MVHTVAHSCEGSHPVLSALLCYRDQRTIQSVVLFSPRGGVCWARAALRGCHSSFPSTRARTASGEEVPSLPAVALYLVSREAGLGVKREVIFLWEVG